MVFFAFETPCSVNSISRLPPDQLHGVPWVINTKDVGTAGATEALVPAMLKPRGRKSLFAPAIICQVYLLVDSQTCKSLFI